MDNDTVERLRKSAEAHFDECREISDHMADDPETGLDNSRAADLITGYLAGHGYKIEKDWLGVKSAFKASKGDSSLPAAALFCETDALPGLEHACGHCLSAAASLLAAACVEDVFPGMPFRVELIGTPGEEYPGGKVMLDKQGAFNDHLFGIMTHMGPDTVPDSGFLACNDRLITFHGKASHASDAPEQGINALNAARLYMDAMDMRRQHLPSMSQLHGVVENGGTMPGIVPDKTVLNYYYRARTMKELQELNAISDDALKGAELMTGATAEQEQVYETYADLYRNPVSRKIVCEVFDSLGIKYEVNEAYDGSSDIGNVDQKIPCFHPYMSISDEHPAVHTKRFAELLKSDGAYRSIMDAGMAMAEIIGRLGTEDGLYDKVRDQHRRYRDSVK